MTLTFDPALAAGSRCKIYLRRSGESTNTVFTGAVDETAMTLGMLENFEHIVLGAYSATSGLMTGALQRLMIWAGAPSKAQLDALPAPNNITITYPQAAPPPVAADLTLALSATENSKTINPALLSTNASAATVAITGKTGNYTAVVVSTDNQTIDVDRQVGNNTADGGTITYTLTTPAGVDTGTITVTIAAVVTTGAAPFPFKTYQSTGYKPSSVVAQPRPIFNATNPRQGAITDFYSGLPVFAVLPPMGTQMLRADGTNSGYYRPQIAKHHISENPVAWSAQSKYLWIGQVHGTFAVSGQTWPSGGVFIRSSDWKIHRFGNPLGGADCWWDDADPDKLWHVSTSGRYRSCNITTGEVADPEFDVNGWEFVVGSSGGADPNFLRKWDRASYSRHMANGAQVRAVMGITGAPSGLVGRKCILNIHLRSINGVGPGVVSILRYPTTVTDPGAAGDTDGRGIKQCMVRATPMRPAVSPITCFPAATT